MLGLRVGEWKSSYRMVLLDHPTKFNLDGFAIITNSQVWVTADCCKMCSVGTVAAQMHVDVPFVCESQSK